jgi:hypothetical protein
VHYQRVSKQIHRPGQHSVTKQEADFEKDVRFVVIVHVVEDPPISVVAEVCNVIMVSKRVVMEDTRANQSCDQDSVIRVEKVIGESA